MNLQFSLNVPYFGIYDRLDLRHPHCTLDQAELFPRMPERNGSFGGKTTVYSWLLLYVYDSDTLGFISDL